MKNKILFLDPGGAGGSRSNSENQDSNKEAK